MGRFKLSLFILVFAVAVASFIFVGEAATNINSINKYAWSDITGWIDFYITNTVTVGNTELQGYASSSVGEISLNCDSTSVGDVCASSDYRVCNGDSSGLSCTNTGTGQLSGCAWNDTVGWISFWCGDSDCQGTNTCSQSDYRVSIDSSGYFQGYAWNDVTGWISFNCSNNGSCGTSDYKVQTTWAPSVLLGYLESQIINTQQTDGVTLNSIIWQGSQPGGTSVDFQVAVSNNSGGPWTYKGPGGSTSAYYGAECPTAGTSNPGAGPNKSICIDVNQVTNYQYLRYKVRLQSNTGQTLTPQVDDIVLNFSP